MHTWWLLMLRCAAAVCSGGLWPALCLLGAGLLQLPAAQMDIVKAVLLWAAWLSTWLVMHEVAAAAFPYSNHAHLLSRRHPGTKTCCSLAGLEQGDCSFLPAIHTEPFLP